VSDQDLSDRLDRIERLLRAVVWLAVDLLGVVVGFGILIALRVAGIDDMWATFAGFVSGLIAIGAGNRVVRRMLLHSD
jgi:hypothetical protein